jgi:Mrp family chromosome partitioning ATPase
MLLAGLVALVLGFGLAIMLDRSDTRLRTRRDAEGRFGLPVIAEIPMLSLPNRRRKVMIAEDPDSIKAEAYRTLRAAVMLYRRRDDPTLPRPRHERITDARAGISGNGRRGRVDRDVILITSPGAGDGKTTTVANLAVAYAESGRSVLVLSCDLWRSGVARRFGVKAGRGISDYLASDDAPPLSSFVRDTSVPGVRIVTGGLSIHRPGGRLIAEQRLIDEARELADVVILDTAPLLSASLTRELTTVVDAVVVVCRVGGTTASEAERCADLLEQLGAPALGVVLVGVTARPFSDYFAYASPRRTRRVVAEAEGAMADEAMAAEISVDGTEHPNGSAPGSRRRGSGSGERSITTGSDDLPGESR